MHGLPGGLMPGGVPTRGVQAEGFVSLSELQTHKKNNSENLEVHYLNYSLLAVSCPVDFQRVLV